MTIWKRCLFRPNINEPYWGHVIPTPETSAVIAEVNFRVVSQWLTPTWPPIPIHPLQKLVLELVLFSVADSFVCIPHSR